MGAVLDLSRLGDAAGGVAGEAASKANHSAEVLTMTRYEIKIPFEMRWISWTSGKGRYEWTTEDGAIGAARNAQLQTFRVLSKTYKLEETRLVREMGVVSHPAGIGGGDEALGCPGRPPETPWLRFQG